LRLGITTETSGINTAFGGHTEPFCSPAEPAAVMP